VLKEKENTHQEGVVEEYSEAGAGCMMSMFPRRSLFPVKEDVKWWSNGVQLNTIETLNLPRRRKCCNCHNVPGVQ
jgi:hypothetical protein